MSELIGLVIGGGGSVGIAWEVGIFKALEEAGVNLKNISHVIGTSAGSLVGAQYFGGRNINDMVNEQKNPGWMVKAAKLLPVKRAKSFKGVNTTTETSAERSLRLASAGGEARSFIPQWLFIKMIGKALKVKDWPESTNYMPTGTDCETGEVRLWSKNDNVPFIKAVASSCCVPRVAPPVRINGRKYVDGGCGSSSNFNIIIEKGVKRAIFVGPFGGEHSPDIGEEKRYLREQIEQVKQAGIEVFVITPRERLAKETGNDILNPALAPIAVECGIEDGLSIANELRAFMQQ